MAKKKWTVARAFPLMLIGAVVVGVIVVAVGSHLRRATVIADSTASLPAGALEGEPCAALTKDEYAARGAKAQHGFFGKRCKAASTSNSVSGRGINTAGETAKSSP